MFRKLKNMKEILFTRARLFMIYSIQPMGILNESFSWNPYYYNIYMPKYEEKYNKKNKPI